MKWEQVRIADVCEVTGGTTPSTINPKYWDGEIVWLSPVDLPEVGSIVDVSNSKKKVTKLALKDCSLKMLPAGTVVYSSRASIGKIGVVISPLVTNQGFTNMIPGNRVHTRYLAYALKYFTPQIEKLGNSTTFNEVSRTSIKNFQIPLPPLTIQQLISDKLDKADAIRKIDRKLLKKYDDLILSIYNDLFGDSFTNDKGWDLYKIGEICKVTKLAGFEYTKYMTYKDKGEIAVIRGLNVKHGSLRLNDVKYVDKVVSDSLLRSKLFKGDVVMTYIGVNIGDVAIIDENDKYHLAPNVSKITPIDNNQLNSYYLLNFLALNRRLFEKYTTNTAKQALNMGNIREIEILIPPIKLQIKFEQIYLHIQTLKLKAHSQSELSHILFESYIKTDFSS